MCAIASSIKYHLTCLLQKVKLTFTSFDVETGPSCKYDNITILDGSSVVGPYCGTDGPQVYYSSGSTLSVRFQSDSSVGRPGFSFAVEFDLPEEARLPVMPM